MSGVAAAMDVNGDDVPDFASVLLVDADGKIVVATIPAPAPDPTSVRNIHSCPGTGSFNASSRAYVLTVPSACLGNAYEVRAAALVLFNRNTVLFDGLDITIDIAPNTLDLPGVHRDRRATAAGTVSSRATVASSPSVRWGSTDRPGPCG